MSQKSALITVFLIVSTELIGFGLIIPILPQISQKFSPSGFWLGILLSSYSVAQMISAPILGQLSDRFGRKSILVLSKLGTLVSYLILANATSYLLLLLSRLVDGFTGGNIAVARAYLSDITEPKNRSKSMAIIGVAFGTGFIFGPALGAICYKYADNFSIAGYVGAALSLGSMLLTIWLIKEPKTKVNVHHIKLSAGIFQTSYPIIQLLVISFLVMSLFSGFETSFSVFTSSKFQFNESQNSIVFLIIGIGAFFIQGAFTRFSIKPIKKAIQIALICISLGLFLSTIFQTPLYSISSLIFLIFGIAIINTHIPAELSLLSQEKGLVMGLYESISSLARIIGPLVVFSVLFNQIEFMYAYMATLSFSFLLIYSIITKPKQDRS